MATYHSTRSRTAQLSAKEAIRRGIAPDGGLYVSDELGQSKIDLEGLANKDYFELAREVLGTLLPDYTADEIAACVDEAYGSSFASDEVTPVVDLKGVAGEADQGSASTYVMELWHGPTSAFKDVALQMLPRLMARTSANAEGAADKIMIVTATSGDTGKAALAGFADAPGCGITVFYPEGKVSRVQELQMSTQEGANVSVCAVRGNFDDAQSAVKRIFADRELADRLAAAGVQLSSANSINVGRLAPQVTYYFDAYAQLVRAGAVELGQKVTFCVPTGNFGDVLAGYYAKLLGLPVARLVVASNRNDVLTDFITTGTYDRRRDFAKTISPSMDILVSSNLERLLYYMSDGDCELVASLMADLGEKGFYQVPEGLLAKIQEVFACGRADDDATRAEIASTWNELGALIDPHTAVAKSVLDAVPADGTVRVCLSTASPYKFSSDVLAALGQDTSGMSGFACMDALEKATGTTAPAQLSVLRDLPVLHKDVCDRAKMGAFVESSCARVFL